jgi:hypothetical protein
MGCSLRVELRCPECYGRLLRIEGTAQLSKFQRKEIDLDSEIEDESLVPFDSSLKIVIPYFEGNELVQRSVRTWVYPEVVWALTDRGIVPPGSGVCAQFLMRRSGKDVGTKRTKPFLRDTLKGLYEMFPKEEYYGFFNSDIILPPGIHPKHLLPRRGFKGVFHHRTIVYGHDNWPVGKLQKRRKETLGKDGLIVDRKVFRRIIRDFSNPLIGAPGWDDSLILWLWDEFGKDQFDFRWDMIWHADHPLQWKYEDLDSKYNFRQLGRKYTTLYDWGKFYDKMEPQSHVKTKKLGIIQPGRVGDILLVAPIAKWYWDKGYHIVWPVNSQFFDVFRHIPYVEAVDIGASGDLYQKALTKTSECDRILNLGIGFGREEKGWLKSRLHFDEWKYKEAKVPFKERYNLKIVRFPEREQELYDMVAEGKDGYVITHSASSFARFDWGIPNGIEVSRVDGYTIVDWLTIIERARAVFCVDSCVANLINLLGLHRGSRFFRHWDYRTVREVLLPPVVDGDWVIWGRSPKYQERSSSSQRGIIKGR